MSIPLWALPLIIVAVWMLVPALIALLTNWASR